MKSSCAASSSCGGTPLRLVTWNCAMALRNKWEQLAGLAPDVAVIQECETPDRWPQGAYTSVLWHGGSNRHKGLAIVTFGNWRLEAVEQLDLTIQHVLPARVVGATTFHLLGVWTKGAPIKERSYIGQLHQAAQVYASWLAAADAAVMGDWNSNAIWDRERRANHSATVALLADCMLASAYHHHYRCAPGSEQHATWYNHKRAERGFHLDYCFIPQRWLPQVYKVEVGSFEQWRTYSDHCPLIVDLWL